jgi:predicted nuclease of predicted toxin-antitoxin system
LLRLVTDENFDGRVLRGLLARIPQLDVVRIQDAGLSGAEDPAVLDFATGENRVLLTHDVRTMTAFAGERLLAGRSLPGVVIVPQVESVGRLIEALQELIASRTAADLADQIVFLKP